MPRVSRASLLLQALQHHGYVVDGLLHLFVIAAVGLRDQFVDFARADLRQNAVTFADGQQDRIEIMFTPSTSLRLVPSNCSALPRSLRRPAREASTSRSTSSWSRSLLSRYWHIVFPGASRTAAPVDEFGRSILAGRCLFVLSFYFSFVYMWRYALTGACLNRPVSMVHGSRGDLASASVRRQDPRFAPRREPAAAGLSACRHRG